MSAGFDLRGDGRVALVTGGAGGLGRALGEVFAAAGYRVLLVDVAAEAAHETARELSADGATASALGADVSQPEGAAAAVAAAGERWGRLDVVINNAGVSGRGAPIEDLDEDDLDRVLAVNLRAPFYLCKHAVPVLRGGGGGLILNVASITAQTGSADYAPYAASKAGVVALTRGLARRLGRFNIRVNCLNPGSIEGTGLMAAERERQDPQVRTRQSLAKMQRIPVGRAAQPRDVAHLALFLASPLARHVHGAVLTVDGGESLGYQ